MHWFLYDKDLRYDRVKRLNDLLTLVRLGFLRIVFSKKGVNMTPSSYFKNSSPDINVQFYAIVKQPI